jgi:hypothetical protein
VVLGIERQAVCLPAVPFADVPEVYMVPVAFEDSSSFVLASYAPDPDAPLCEEVSSEQARDPEHDQSQESQR